MSAIDRVRRPEYTGANRCLPCTAVNIVLALALAGGVGVLVTQLVDAPTVGGATAAVVLTLALGAIALRGYLVPGTPTITKRYFPDRVLAWFDKTRSADADGSEVDIEAVLRAANAVEPCRGNDLCLTDAFAADWEAAIDHAQETGADPVTIANALGLPEDDIAVHEHGTAFVLTPAENDRQHLGQWESVAALYADIGGATVLAERTADWERLGPVERSTVLGGLRLFLSRCPACDGPVSFGEETVESCCREIDVVAVSCADCGARVFEQATETLATA
jgi:hypothetical protein